MPSPSEVDNFQRLLTTLSAQAVAAVTALWDTLSTVDAVTRWKALHDAYPAVVDPFINASAVLTAEWYSSIDPASSFAVVTQPPPPTAILHSNVGWALALADPLTNLIGSLERQVFNASRDTILSNAEKEGTKWARHASANACSFCRILATRGAVYASEAAAQSVVGRGKDLSPMERRMRAAGTPLPFRPRFSGQGAAVDPGAVSLGGNKRRGGKGGKGRFIAGGAGQLRGSQTLGEPYHDNCHCIAVPVRNGAYEPPDYVAQWDQDYGDARAALKASGDVKNQFGALDTNKIVNQMRRDQYPEVKDRLNAERRKRYADQKEKP